ncbi:MAG: hypothetical protein M1486_05910, partial [Gammaproteobacteria bacterium]|nr:hypothetical protein [Gammaproteobacteria bacterium]
YIQWLGDRQDSEDLRDHYEQSQIKFLKALKHLDKVSKICAVCGKEFTASKAAKFCSNACRQKNKYKNSKK